MIGLAERYACDRRLPVICKTPPRRGGRQTTRLLVYTARILYKKSAESDLSPRSETHTIHIPINAQPTS